jgi:hypothetical protein
MLHFLYGIKADMYLDTANAYKMVYLISFEKHSFTQSLSALNMNFMRLKAKTKVIIIILSIIGKTILPVELVTVILLLLRDFINSSLFAVFANR